MCLFLFIFSNENWFESQPNQPVIYSGTGKYTPGPFAATHTRASLTAAPLGTAPDGMIIYVTDSASLYIRKNNAWQRMSVDSVGNSNNWNINGNTGIDSTKHFIGTIDQQALVFKVNNAERLRLDGNGNIKVATGSIRTGRR